MAGTQEILVAWMKAAFSLEQHTAQPLHVSVRVQIPRGLCNCPGVHSANCELNESRPLRLEICSPLLLRLLLHTQARNQEGMCHKVKWDSGQLSTKTLLQISKAGNSSPSLTLLSSFWWLIETTWIQICPHEFPLFLWGLTFLPKERNTERGEREKRGKREEKEPKEMWHIIIF